MNKLMTPDKQAELKTKEVDLLELLQAVWVQKIKVVIIVFVFSVISVVFAMSKPDIYRSQVLLVAADHQASRGGLSALSGQFGGLASLAGVDFGGGGGGVTEALAILKSRHFIVNFVRDNDLLVPLFAYKPVRFSKLVKIDPKVYNEQEGTWVRDISPPYTKGPTDWEIYKSFSRVYSVNQDKGTGMILLSVEWYDPVQAQQWVSLLVEKINSRMKNRDVAEARKSIQFLRDKLQETSLVDLHESLYGLIEAQAKTIMLAEVREEYAFRTIDPAVVPLEKSKPKRALICVLGALMGGVFGVFWALFSYFGGRRKS